MTLFPDAAALDADLLDALRLFGAAADFAASEPLGTSARIAAYASAFSAGRGDAAGDVRAIFLAGFLHGAKALHALRPASDTHAGLAVTGVARAVASAAGQPCADALRWHCERWDGTGKPDGLFRGEIPVNAAMLGAARLFVDGLLGEAAGDPAYGAYLVLNRSGRDIQPSLADAFVAFVASLGGEEPSVSTVSGAFTESEAPSETSPKRATPAPAAIVALIGELVESDGATGRFAAGVVERARTTGISTEAAAAAELGAHLTALDALPVLEASGAFRRLAGCAAAFSAARGSGDPGSIDAAIAGLPR